MATLEHSDKTAFDKAIEQLQIQAANFGAHLSLDAAVRQAYARNIAAMANDLRMQASTGAITWMEAAEQTNSLRNIIMENMRGQSSSIGTAIAQQMKRSGNTLNILIGEKVLTLYGSAATFDGLSGPQKNTVYAAVVDSAGTSRPAVTALMRRLSYVGRGLLVATIAISVYNIASADDKPRAAVKEGTVVGGSILGGVAGGALAGLACGPGAPVCVAIGAFVGGTLAALGISALW